MKQGLTLLAVLVLAIASFWYALSPIDPQSGRPRRDGDLVALGLDLKGGMRVSLEPDPTKEGGRNVTRETMERVARVLENRVNTFGLAGTEVRLKGDQQVLVVLPGARNPEQALKTLSTVAQLEFRHFSNVQNDRNMGARYRMDVTRGDPAKGEPDTYTFFDTETQKTVDQEQVIQESELILKGNLLKPTSTATINTSTGQPVVTFELNSEGARIFGDFTREHVGEILAVVLDNRVVSAPRINEPITEGRGEISGSATVAEARVLANLLNSGALPIPLRPAETQFVGATLGRDSIEKSVRAGVAGLVLVLVFMLAYYWLPGLLACVALLFYAALTFCVYKGCAIFPPIPLDLPGITGFILSVGMAVDANILIFERLKEELREGKGLHAAIDAGFSRAFSSIFDSNVTTWIVCAILIWLGAPIIKGFAITLSIGVAVSMFTAITVTRTLLHFMVRFPFARNARAYALNVSWLNLFFPSWQAGNVLKVYSKRRIYFGISIAVGAVALVFTLLTPFGLGLKPAIDFTGGAVIEAPFRDNKVTAEQVRQALAEAGITDATVRIGYSERPWTRLTLTATEVDAASQRALERRLAEAPGLESFDPGAYKAVVENKTLKVEATYTGEVTEELVRRALSTRLNPDDIDLDLKELRLTLTPEPRTGENRVAIAEILTRADVAQQEAARQKLAGIGGGIIQPMYQQTTIGPTVAREVTFGAFASVAVASLAIILYLATRFAIGGFYNGLKFGICAVVALVHDVGIVIGIFSLMGFLANWQVDSLFVTAALTILGFSVHDTIVVYDRIRENLHHRRRGETFADVSDRSITQTFDRSLNTTITVLFVVAVLVAFGGETVRLFNVALLIGVAIGTYSSIFVAAPLVVALEKWLAARSPAAAPAGAGRAAPGRSGRRDGDVKLEGLPAPRPGAAGRPSTRPAAANGPAAGVAPQDATTAATEGEGTPIEDAASATSSARPGTIRPKRRRRM